MLKSLLCIIAVCICSVAGDCNMNTDDEQNAAALNPCLSKYFTDSPTDTIMMDGNVNVTCTNTRRTCNTNQCAARLDGSGNKLAAKLTYAQAKAQAIYQWENSLCASSTNADAKGTCEASDRAVQLESVHGYSNFNESQIQKVYDAAEIKPANLQVECHAHWPQFELHDFCKKLGISFTAYAPIGSPSRWTIEPDDAILMEDPLITKLAEKYKKTPAQICLRWLMQRGIAVIPKSVTPKRIEENFNVWDFEIDKEDFKAMSEIKKKRLFFMKVFGQFSEYPWKSEL